MCCYGGVCCAPKPVLDYSLIMSGGQPAGQVIVVQNQSPQGPLIANNQGY